MLVVSRYSFKNGLESLETERPSELSDVLKAIELADLRKCTEPGKPGKPLYSPKAMSREILNSLYSTGWSRPKVPLGGRENLIEGDALMNGVGLEVQFGRYSFLGWDSLRKMSLLGEHGICKLGIEIVPMASLRQRMSKGVGSFEQVTERLEKAGNLGLKIPVLVLGIDG